jgi:hypothetical protein
VHLHDLVDQLEVFGPVCDERDRPAVRSRDQLLRPVLAQVTPAQRHATVLGVADAGGSGVADRYANPVGSGVSQRPKQSRVPQARSIGSPPAALGTRQTSIATTSAAGDRAHPAHRPHAADDRPHPKGMNEAGVMASSGGARDDADLIRMG